MKIAFVVPNFFNKNRIFSEFDFEANRDDCLRPFIELKKVFANRGVVLETADILPIKEADAVLCLNMPKSNSRVWKDVARNNIPIHVIALESEYIHTDNVKSKLIQRCTTIFTSSDDLINYKNFLPIRFAQVLRPPFRHPWEKRKFSCMISGNKASSHLRELYSKRLKIINWYESFSPDLFDLYGVGWDAVTPSNLFNRILRRIPLLRSFTAPKLNVYRGVVNNKFEILANYRFCYCFENFDSPNGWITEKIFDAMFAGCIPVYWGPANIAQHIPESCYINASRFSTPKDLHQFLVSLDDKKCDSIIDSIEKYLRSDNAKRFSVEAFTETLVKRLGEYDLRND